ncbi:MAG TPA: hypothetical protein VGH76_06205 [Actinomycetospora sp.]|uniref:hypothetical protein n=1 Tax=Actinomycetospora sp. TaxID=1872135 RepID=UPI002F4005FA
MRPGEDGPGDGRRAPAVDPGADDAVVRHGDGHAPRPGEEALFAALDRTRAELAAAPAPPLPAGFAARMQERLAAEGAAGADDAGSGAPPPSGSGRGGRNRPPGRSSSRPPGRPAGRGGPHRTRRRLLAAGLGALALVAAVTGGVRATTGDRTGPVPTAAATPGPVTPGPGPVPVSGADPVRALRAGLGAHDPGPLADPGRRGGCLVAHGLPAGTVPLGTRQVVLDGRPGTLLVLPTGTAGRFRLLVVGPRCTAGSPDTLADLTVGG